MEKINTGTMLLNVSGNKLEDLPAPAGAPGHTDAIDINYLQEYIMQDFFQKMYSTVDECPFSVNNPNEW